MKYSYGSEHGTATSLVCIPQPGTGLVPTPLPGIWGFEITGSSGSGQIPAARILCKLHLLNDKLQI